MKKSRKKFTKEFKILVLRELENGKIAAQLCRENDIHPSMLTKWKKEYKENPENAFLKKVLTRLEMKRKEDQIQKEGT